MVNAKDFLGTDNEKIDSAILGRGADGIVVIEGKENGEPWLLDRAILLPENTTVILRNVKLKLSDKCRDNFFRTANCGLCIDEPKKIKNVRIIGEGRAVLEGADYPRATGDSSKVLSKLCPFTPEDICKYADWVPQDRKASGKLNGWDKHSHSYGTDAGKEGESQFGDWRGVGVLFANVDDFTIENLRIVKPHGWSISIESGTNGRICKIDFDACMYKEIDGMKQNMENQDGIDIRNGCHHILISDITGMTGDDVIALTAAARKDLQRTKGGSLNDTHVMNNDWTNREDGIHDIVIRNVMATSSLCWVVRLLPIDTIIYNVIIDGVIDTDDVNHHGTIFLGENGYGATMDDEKECMRNIIVSNIVSGATDHAVCVGGYLRDSIINNVIYKIKDKPAIVLGPQDALKNVTITNIQTVN